MDVDKQIAYWVDGSRIALRSVPVLEEGEFWVEALFWTHLAVEKALKAHVVKSTRQIPPYIHKLLRLSQIARIDLSTGQVKTCEALSIYQRIARYPDNNVNEPDSKTAKRLLADAQELHQWLIERL
jgi:HEPN domain-containing protein